MRCPGKIRSRRAPGSMLHEVGQSYFPSVGFPSIGGRDKVDGAQSTQWGTLSQRLGYDFGLIGKKEIKKS